MWGMGGVVSLPGNAGIDLTRWGSLGRQALGSGRRARTWELSERPRRGLAQGWVKSEVCHVWHGPKLRLRGAAGWLAGLVGASGRGGER